MCDVIGELQEARVIGAGGIGKIFGEVSDSANLRAAAPKGFYPGSCSLVKPSLGENQESTLCVALSMKAGKKEIESTANLLNRQLYRVFAMERRRFLDCDSKENHASSVRAGKDVADFIDHHRSRCGGYIAPEVLSLSHG